MIIHDKFTTFEGGLFAFEMDNYISFDFSIEITAPHK